jgi:hypothetical protein
MPIHQLLKQYKVDIVFHGHDHLYARQDFDGIIYQTVPQPGDPVGHTRSAQQYGYSTGNIYSSSGHLRVKITGDKAIVDYINSAVPGSKSNYNNGELVYTYTIIK